MDNHQKQFFMWVLGFTVGVGAMIFVYVIGLSDFVKETNTIIQQCEKSLPRDKHCVLMAVEADKLKEIEQ